jgi:hypothetical protein
VRATSAAAGGAALVALTVALIVIAFGVIATAGVYGSRMAWLLGVALPLLAISMLLAKVALRAPAPAGVGPDRNRTVAPSGRKGVRVVFVAAAIVFAIPLMLAMMLLAVDGLFLAAHAITTEF